jgi:hypothetical protein
VGPGAGLEAVMKRKILSPYQNYVVLKWTTEKLFVLHTQKVRR